MTRFLLDDPLLDAQALRVARSVIYGGADDAEVRAACSRLRGTDLAAWFESVWITEGDLALALGEAEESSGHIEPARNAYLRGADDHCEVGARLLSVSRAVVWLARCPPCQPGRVVA